MGQNKAEQKKEMVKKAGLEEGGEISPCFSKGRLMSQLRLAVEQVSRFLFRIVLLLSIC